MNAVESWNIIWTVVHIERRTHISIYLYLAYTYNIIYWCVLHYVQGVLVLYYGNKYTCIYHAILHVCILNYALMYFTNVRHASLIFLHNAIYVLSRWAKCDSISKIKMLNQVRTLNIYKPREAPMPSTQNTCKSSWLCTVYGYAHIKL